MFIPWCSLNSLIKISSIAVELLAIRSEKQNAAKRYSSDHRLPSSHLQLFPFISLSLKQKEKKLPKNSPKGKINCFPVDPLKKKHCNEGNKKDKKTQKNEFQFFPLFLLLMSKAEIDLPDLYKLIKFMQRHPMREERKEQKSAVKIFTVRFPKDFWGL